MKVLLTGAFGNIGSHTVPELLRQGHEVRCLDLDSPGARKVAGQFEGKVEVHWGNLRDAGQVSKAVTGVEAVVHLAAVIPPQSDEAPERAKAVNVGGTTHVVAACREQPMPPRLLFTSTFDVYGHCQSKPPPRRVEEPVQGTDPYTHHKIECERLVRESGLEWCIFRLSDVPVMGLRDAHPIMFEIGLHNRIEAMHPDDAALALAGALKTPEVWGRVLHVGGGPTCQVTYRDYLDRLLTAMGVGMLPEEAFSPKDYVTDWIDSSEAQRHFGHQRHTFDDIVEEIAACLGWKKYVVPLARPLARRMMLKLSPYWAKRSAA
ncbi:MAG: NAD(P)-dependent oxidoreductase [Deltaproteobacteria bacterium]|nr:NAD(P)-dependent oxidoreductase [Deltaproteobacteria bacterium]